jgi:uracil-DNA glycosylase
VAHADESPGGTKAGLFTAMQIQLYFNMGARGGAIPDGPDDFYNTYAVPNFDMDVYITNTVKCRPPKNRLPRASERRACVRAHLSREIAVVEPNVVVLLGRTAVAALLRVDSLKEVRGRPKSRDGTTYFGTYHPAAILRNPRLKQTFVRDLRAAIALGNQGNSA